MNPRNASKAAILENIRALNAGAVRGDYDSDDYASIDRAYRRAPALERDACIELMIERLREYDAEVVECTAGTLSETIAAQLAASGRRRFVAPAGLAPEWMAAGYEWRVDDGLTQDEIEAAEGVLTACFCAVADSGTIVLHHGLEEGRRILTLLPDWHLCVLRESQIVEVLPEYFVRVSEPPVLATYISGPSATADIEMTRIKGVHGPRFLHVILVRGC